MKRFYSHGKLLLSGEYLVLDGAKALALPTKPGQDLRVESIDDHKLHWKSFDHEGTLWLEAIFELPTLEVSDYINGSKEAIQRLHQILCSIRNQKPGFLINDYGFSIETHLEFPANWGLGSSSTLISNLAVWAGIDPYLLLNDTLGGSGYDLACAGASGPILYQNLQDGPLIMEVSFDPEFKDHLYFLHLNRKQNSRESISHYLDKREKLSDEIKRVSQISESLIRVKTVGEFQDLIQEHEQLLSEILDLNTVKQELFPDFAGSLKSLGGWGGDMILVVSESDPTNYFSDRDFNILIPYQDLIL